MTARLQLALDQVDLHRALRAAREGVAGGVQILEVGTPLLKAEGLAAVRAIREAFPKHDLVCDAKTMAAGRLELEAAAKAGASMGTVLGVASDSTIEECVEAGRNYGIQILVDLLGCPDPVARAAWCAEIGADAVNVHCPIDEQVRGGDPFEMLRAVRAAVSIPVTVAGGITAKTAPEAIEAGADVIIVGGAITKAEDATAAARGLLEAMATGVPGETEMADRVSSEDELRRIFTEVSTANVSDAMHRAPCWSGMVATQPDARVAGRAVTCRAVPGDWAKPVEAIDECQPGDILVIDSGGVPPAVWGELATNSARNQGIAAVIVHGAIRDTRDIQALGVPVYARTASSNAGEPKGFGEIGITLRVEGIECRPGDWIVADGDGIVVVPKARAIEVANRAMYCLEAENRIRAEINADDGGTLAQVVDLYKWEKKVVGGDAETPPASNPEDGA
ncbi:MAG: orotidine 5'-phosphate decarboxylase [Planctomycetota bacterium]|nr:orotidine 5'-phosphate decarboxylase [Planctomycetota bacterium]